MGAFIAQSVNPKVFTGDFVDEMFWGTFYLQHRGTDFCGLAMLDKDGKILLKTHAGWFRPAFQDDLTGFCGPSGIGHISARDPEPVLMQSTFPDFALCFVGSINNRDQIKQTLLEQGQVFTPGCEDAILLARLIAASIWDKRQSEEENFIRGVNHLSQAVEGAFAIAILTEKQIFVIRGLDGHQMVVLGKKNGAVVAASESCGFYNLGLTIDKELESGEIVVLKDGNAESIGKINSEKNIMPYPCSFKWVYTANAASVILNRNVKEVRHELGARLARRDIAGGFFPDVIMPIKDSGGYAAIGYLNEFIRQAKEGKIDIAHLPIYDESLLRFIYAGRSYTPSDEIVREMEAKIKQIPIPDANYQGLSVVIVDDSIVTGNQFKRDLVPKVRACGFKEVHARISFPMLVSICPWGRANKRKKKLAAVKDDDQIRTEVEMAQYLGLDSCHYNTLRDVAEAIGIPEDKLCLDCTRLS